MFAVASSQRPRLTSSGSYQPPKMRSRTTSLAQPQKPRSVHRQADRLDSPELMPMRTHSSCHNVCCCCCCSSGGVITRNSTRSRHSYILTGHEESIPSPTVVNDCSDVFDSVNSSSFGDYASFNHLETLKKVCTEESRKVNNLKECVSLGMDNKRRATKSKQIDGIVQVLFTGCPSAFRQPLEQATTPFEALDDFRREAPSYWLSSTYAYKPDVQILEMTIRQTGVLPNLKVTNELSHLILEITVSVPKKRKQTKQIVLKQKGKDNSFKSSTVDFFILEKNVESTYATYRIYAKQRFCPKKVAEWKVSLKDCSSSEIYRQFNKVSFLK